MKNTVITICHQCGSGGEHIGRILADRLGIPLYDSQLFDEAAKNSSIHRNFFASAESTGMDLFSHIFDSPVTGPHMPINDRIFIEQALTIQKLASDGPCVIIGRGGNYVLKEFPYVLNVFVFADLNVRRNRIINEYNIRYSEADCLIESADKKRAAYLKAYTGQAFGQAANYHLCIDSGLFGPDEAACIIESAYSHDFK